MSKDRAGSSTIEVDETLSTERSVEALTSQEESLLRMRQGRPLAPEAPLARKAEAGTEVAERLTQLEASLLQEARERLAERRPATDGRAKAKIVRALRRKG